MSAEYGEAAAELAALSTLVDHLTVTYADVDADSGDDDPASRDLGALLAAVERLLKVLPAPPPAPEPTEEYLYIVAWGVHWGSNRDYVQHMRALAAQDGAPGDVYECRDWGQLLRQEGVGWAVADVEGGRTFIAHDDQGKPVRLWRRAADLSMESRAQLDRYIANMTAGRAPQHDPA